MTRVISVHEYILRPDVKEVDFENAVQEASRRGLLQFAGLDEYHFVRGIRGTQSGCYGTIWIYESKEAWEMLWGSVEKPLSRVDYPEKWKVWEQEVLAPFLEDAPDKIRFTAYEEY
ncbi:hypothetical protein ACFLUA_02820 [Chloroflexota bacterium]